MSSPAPTRLAIVVLLAAAPLAGEPLPGTDLASVDRTVKPGDDFDAYVNGAWRRANEIPPDRSSIGSSATIVERTTQRVADLIQELAASAPKPGTDARRIADFHASLVDRAGIEAKGLAPLQPILARIAAIATRTDLSRVLGENVRADVDAFNATDLTTDNLLGVWVAQDLEDPTRYSAFLLQGGLDMPERAYYLGDAPRMAELRAKLREHVANVLRLAGFDDAEARAARVVALETKIAHAHASRAETNDPRNGLNRWPRADLDAKAPGIDWDAFLAAAKLDAQKEVVAWQPQAVAGMSALVASEPIDSWKDWLAFHLADRNAEALPDAFGTERFAFHGTALAGTPQRRELAKRAVDATNAALGEAVGRLYVERYFPPEHKAAVQEMVANILAAFSKRIDALAWMSPATKNEAKAKLAVLKVGVGHPDRWRDWSGLEIVKGDAFGNLQRAERFDTARELAKLGKPVDRSEWVMSPQTVNAVNLPAMNAMNFPAAYLQPPMFDPARPTALNYGAIGTTIGHEISHSFDNHGAEFDARGRLRNWWTAEDKAHFEAAAEKLVKQYDAYRPLPDLGIDGRLTLGENIADVAGVAAAHDAWKASLGGKPAPASDGLSGDEQFFLSFGLKWRNKMREATLRQRLLTDGHAPAPYRVLTVRNLDPWYAAFGVKPGEALYLAPDERVRIW